MGRLYVVATPIGNLKDITYRAVETLQNVDIIACEDTRVTRKLLNAYSIKGKKLISYHEHNEKEISKKILNILLEGKDVALVSDAGTPCISDPGYRVVKLARENKVDVIPVPGAFAGAAALSVSGLPSDRFLFVGFLPTKKKQKEKALKEYMDTGFTFILYESPLRVLDTLELIHKLSSRADLFVAKELTKMHEMFFWGNVYDVLNQIKENREILKGEFVIIVHPYLEEYADEDLIKNEAKKMISKGLKTKQIAKELSDRFGISKNVAYKIVLDISQNE